jgi:D-alanyl-D-alanine carboxypeptidase (penicillin-binding protein 5/6)
VTSRPLRPRLAPLAVALALVLGVTPSALRAQTPPPTPVPPSGSPSPFPTVLETPKPAPAPPKVSAGSAILVDLNTGQVLHAKAADQRRPIASITKLMTALLSLEGLEPSRSATVSANAASQLGAELGLAAGERVKVKDLLYAILLQSSNDAAVALAERVGGTESAFVSAMNARAAELGLRDTRFFGPTGLDDRGYSTAREVATITRETFEWPLFARIVRTKFRTIAAAGPDRRIQNRNVLLWLYSPTIGVKTGFTSAAGHCLVAAARFEGMELLAVVLGSPEDAFSDGAALLDYGLRRFRIVTFVDPGESLGSLFLEGGVRVDAVAAGALVGLVREDHLDSIEYRLLPAKDLRLPILAGQRVGREVVLVDGRRVAVVGALAASSVPGPLPQPAPDGPPSAEDAGRVLAAVMRALLSPFL